MLNLYFDQSKFDQLIEDLENILLDYFPEDIFEENFLKLNPVEVKDELID